MEDSSLSVILASSSPRRLALLKSVGVAVRVVVPNVEEIRLEGEPAGVFVERMACAKAATVSDAAAGDAIVVAADTVVVDGDRVLGKPAHAAAAHEMLQSLAGREHRVATGYCVRRRARVLSANVWSTVRLRGLDSSEIAAYVASGEPLDKAGSYGIQGQGGALVESVEGSYTNVVGLPMTEVMTAVRALVGP